MGQRAEVRVKIGGGPPILEDVNDEMRLAPYRERIA